MYIFVSRKSRMINTDRIRKFSMTSLRRVPSNMPISFVKFGLVNLSSSFSKAADLLIGGFALFLELQFALFDSRLPAFAENE